MNIMELIDELIVVFASLASVAALVLIVLANISVFKIHPSLLIISIPAGILCFFYLFNFFNKLAQNILS